MTFIDGEAHTDDITQHSQNLDQLLLVRSLIFILMLQLLLIVF